MALQGNHTVTGEYLPIYGDGVDRDAVVAPAANDWSVAFAAAYVVVESVNGPLANSSASIIVYQDSTKGAVVRRFTVYFTQDPNGANSAKQAYEYLKTLAEFSGMADVLEPGQTA